MPVSKKKVVKKKKPVKKIKSWSFSRYSLYNQCPLKLKLSAIDKIKEPGSPALIRGRDIHDMAEKYIKGQLPKMPIELALFKKEFTMLKGRYKKRLKAIVVEDNWAFTKDWNETRWDDWVNCWVRIKLDCAHEIKDGVLIITDWKTGKIRPEDVVKYMEQLSLYALAAFLLHPYLTEVRPRLAFLDHGVYFPGPNDEEVVYYPNDVNMLKKLWSKRVRPMLNDTKFAPKPNRFCGWCFYRASNKANGGGQCKY